MAAGACNLKGAFHILLSLYVGKVEIPVAACPAEFGACVDNRGLYALMAAEKSDNLTQRVSAVDIEPVDYCSLRGVGLRHNHSAET